MKIFETKWVLKKNDSGTIILNNSYNIDKWIICVAYIFLIVLFIISCIFFNLIGIVIIPFCTAIIHGIISTNNFEYSLVNDGKDYYFMDKKTKIYFKIKDWNSLFYVLPECNNSIRIVDVVQGQKGISLQVQPGSACVLVVPDETVVFRNTVKKGSGAIVIWEDSSIEKCFLFIKTLSEYCGKNINATLLKI